GRGTGLGLAIVHRIVTDHQGAIRVEDNSPQGTVFTVELPMG
ncbi:MAG TPA: ATP-binding protein, partial [Thermoanaerobaculia bacterium]